MNGRLVDTSVLAWVNDLGKHEAVAFDEGTDLDDLARKNIEAVRLEVHVNEKEIANVGRLHTKQHHLQLQNALPFRRGSATHRPRESVMLDDDVIEHRCPDLVVPQQRVETVDASMAA